MKRFKYLVLVLCFAACGTLHVGAGVLVASKAPAFEAVDLSGERKILADQKKKLVVLEWTDPECPAVQAQYESGAIPKAQAWAKEKGIEWWVINSSKKDSPGDYSAEKMKAWLDAKQGCPSAVIRDLEGALKKQYGPTSTPIFFIVDSAGYIAYRGAFDNSANRKVLPTTEPRAYVVEALENQLHNRAVVWESTSPDGCPLER